MLQGNSQNGISQVLSRSFQVLIRKIATMENKEDKLRLLGLFKEFSHHIIFVPVKFSFNETTNKIAKKPLVKWKEFTLEESKNKLEEVIKKYQEGKFKSGIALRIEDLGIIALDIDDTETFERAINKSKEEILEDFKKDAYLIIKSLKRGFHIYLNPILAKRIVDSEINNNQLQELYGFEVKKQGLIVFPPSTFQYEDKFFECRIFYINLQNFEKTEAESGTLKKIYNLIDNLRIRNLKTETEKFEKNLEEKRKKYKALKEIIQKVKKKVSFKDLIPEYFAKDHGNYALYHCPIHPPDKHPSFAVYKNSDFECGCDFHDGNFYDIISFYQKFHNCDFVDALRDLCKLAGIKFSRETDIKKLEINVPFETRKAFYTGVVAEREMQRKRYAMLKKEKEIWEVLEKEEIEKLNRENRRINRSEPYEIKEEEIIGDFYYRIAIFRKNKVANFIIKEGFVYKDQITSSIFYDLVLETANKKNFFIKEATLDEIIMKMKSCGLVVSNQKIKDVLSEVLLALEKKQKIKQKEFTKTGFFFDTENDELKVSKLEVKNYEKEDLKSALIFLNELVDSYYSHILEKFATVFKWFITAPFSFFVKQKGSFLRGLYLYGSSGTGKTSVCVISSYLWGNFKNIKGEGKTGASIDTIARLGAVLSQDTFPEVISEPAGPLQKEEILEAIKNAITNITVRGKYLGGNYIEIPALSNIAFTSNYFIPKNDEAFLRRFSVITFSISEKPKKEVEEFLKMKDLAKKFLPNLGNAIIFYINELKELIFSLTQNSQLSVAEEILKFLYKKVDLKIPEWVYLQCEGDFNLKDWEEEIKYSIISNLKEIFIKEVKDKALFFPEEKSGKKLIKRVLEENLISFAFLKKNVVYLTSKILPKLKVNIPNLKALAEILNYHYEKRKSFRIGNQIFTASVISIPYEEFFELIFSSEEGKEEKEEVLKIWNPEDLGLKLNEDVKRLL